MCASARAEKNRYFSPFQVKPYETWTIKTVGRSLETSYCVLFYNGACRYEGSGRSGGDPFCSLGLSASECSP